MIQKEIKQKIIDEITKLSFPDMEFLFRKDTLKYVKDILFLLLKKEKKFFKDLLKKDKKDLTFKSLYSQNPLYYLFSLVEHYDSVNRNDITKNIIEEFEPKYIDFLNKLSFSKEYYEIHKYIYKYWCKNDEEKRIIKKRLESFERNWINLEKEKQERLKKINIKLKKIENDFEDNILQDKKWFLYHIEDDTFIKDLPENTLKNALRRAYKNNIKWYLFDSDPTWYFDVINYCTNRKIRKDFIDAFSNFSSSGKYDNRRNILKILKLKFEKANILGYQNYASYSLSEKMAKDTKTVFDLYNKITSKAKSKRIKDINEIKDYFNLDEIDYFDLDFFITKYKKEKYNIDEKILREYFDYENVLNYMFEFAKNFYSIDIEEIKIKTYDKNVRVFLVKKDQKELSYYFLDPYYRPNKRSWAWANNLRSKDIFQEKIKIPIVVNVFNFQPGQDWKTLLTLRDVETLFHEFGHALHEMLSVSDYRELSWFNVEWDFVELPSQITENWANHKNALSIYAKHYKTNERLSDEILDTLEKLKTFASWISILKQNMFAILDLKLYSEKPPKTIKELDLKCKNIINDFSLFKRSKYNIYTSFSHIFAWGYSAWYYSYMRSLILEADIFEKIEKMWMFDKNTWKLFFDTIMWQWSKKDAKDLFFDFMWREVKIDAFLKRFGF